MLLTTSFSPIFENKNALFFNTRLFHPKCFYHLKNVLWPFFTQEKPSAKYGPERYSLLLVPYFKWQLKLTPRFRFLFLRHFFVWMYYLIFLNGNASKCLSRYGVILGSNQSGFKIGKLLQWPSKKKARKNCRSIWRKIFTKMTNNNNRQNGGWYFAYSRRLTWKSCCWSTDRIWVRSQWWGSRRSCAAGLRRTRCRFGSDV